jgi:hypothetical protein
MVKEWHGHGMASVNQTRPHCVNRMGKTHCKRLVARHVRGLLCVNRPLISYQRFVSRTPNCEKGFFLVDATNKDQAMGRLTYAAPGTVIARDRALHKRKLQLAIRKDMGIRTCIRY